jgi:stage II sporulation protein AA (anti-sigma F factor antagonist)
VWPLRIADEGCDGTMVLALTGRVGHASTAGLAGAITSTAQMSGGRVVLDLGRVDYISSAGLKVLEEAAADCAELGGVLVLAALTEPVRIALDLGGLLPRVAVEPSRDRAVARAQEGKPTER